MPPTCRPSHQTTPTDKSIHLERNRERSPPNQCPESNRQRGKKKCFALLCRSRSTAVVPWLWRLPQNVVRCSRFAGAAVHRAIQLIQLCREDIYPLWNSLERGGGALMFQEGPCQQPTAAKYTNLVQATAVYYSSSSTHLRQNTLVRFLPAVLAGEQ